MSDDREKIIKEYRDINSNFNKQKNELIEQLKSYIPITVKDWGVSNSAICFMFSCPGEKELVADKVCSGNTGTNLDNLLVFLNKRDQALFPSIDRYDYSILNASNHVNFPALTDQTEEPNSEIMSADNLKRIEEFFTKYHKIKYVICCGNKAYLLKDKINSLNGNIIIVLSNHLGYQSLNQIEDDVNGQTITKKGYDATKLRLEVVADKIMRQINGVK